MKPIVPSVPLSMWKNLYAAAQKFKELQPWEILDGTDLFGVRDPVSGETGYGLVMGSGGTVFGFCLYLGAGGFHVFQGLMEGDIDPVRDDIFAIQNCLKLELGPRADLEREDHAVIRQLGLTFKGNHAWPEFRSLLPGFVPWYLTEGEARFLTLALTAARHHAGRIVSGDVTDSIRDGECLVYIAAAGSETKYAAGWEPWPAAERRPVAPLPLVLARLTALRAKKLKPDTPWEAGVFYLPSPILDYERPYFMRLATVCQESSGHSFEFELMTPGKMPHQALADAICSSIEKSGFLPETIFVRSAEEVAALRPLANALGSNIRWRKNLETIQAVKEAMFEQMVRGGGR
ncbi:MAG TPA: hypothetical protein VGR15_04180 [Bacteroidota bacterium]|jgi:hypothetical protein|nr:hypothetical protein [Bacteroidota bacterium]